MICSSLDPTLRLKVNDSSHVGEARRLISNYGRDLGFSKVEVGTLAIIVTEMATNLNKHAAGGELFVRTVSTDGFKGLEVMSIDAGPGMQNSARCLQDGFSTVGSPGTGFGAIIRASTEFDLHSLPGKGTAVMSRYWSRRSLKEKPALPFDFGTVIVPIKGEEKSGDGWAIDTNEKRSRIMVSDGIGHGAGAAEATEAAIQIFLKNSKLSPAAVIESISSGLRGTRGAALAVAEIDRQSQVIHYVGIGNIAGRIVTDGAIRNFISHNGIVGQPIRKIQVYSYPLVKESVLIINSDGLTTKLSLEQYPGLSSRSPSIIAAVLYRDFSRGTDDAVIVVA